MKDNRPTKKFKLRVIPPTEKKVYINTPFIKLDAAMKLSDIASTGGMAKILIEDGAVRVNGEICLQRGKKLYPGDKILFDNTVYEISEKE